MLNVCFMSIGFPNFRYDIAQKILDKSLEWMRQNESINLIECRKVLIQEEDIKQEFIEMKKANPDVFILQLGTYSYGSALMMYLQEIKDVHLVLWSLREPMIPDYPGLPLNSLCALNMYTSFLYRMEITDFSVVYGGLEEKKIHKKLSSILKACAIKKKLHQAKFCVVGGRVPGFYLSNVDELKFRQKIGPEIINLSIASLIQRAESIEVSRVQEDIKKTKTLVGCISASEESMEKTSRVYLALKDYAKENQITAYALKCWPDFQEVYNLAICGVVSKLNNEGLLASCEGDVTGLATMLIQQELTDMPVFLTDLVNISEEGTVKLWHCGAAAPALARDKNKVCMGEHPTMKQGLGVGVNMDLMPGKLTVCKLSEGDPYRLLICEGECIEPDRQLTGNQGDIKLIGSTDKLLETIVEKGIEHHYCIAYNCDTDSLKIFGKICGFEILEV